ncbi:MAG TPA: ABC transporter permease [Syntrophorhabdaceae bacterium]|nr:ABC transporter permease [Syntrophorhabdaceae bacterium]
MTESHLKIAIRRIRKDRLAVAGFLVICIFALVACLDCIPLPVREASGIRWGRTALDAAFNKEPEKSYSPPLADRGLLNRKEFALASRHLLGTNNLGEDVLYNGLKGVRTAFVIGIVPTLIAALFAVMLGLFAGYYGGFIDDLIQYVYQVLSSIPSILLLIAMLMIMERGLWQLCVALGVTSWVGLCRLIRGETLKVKNMEYVEAARALGASDARLIFRHILPNVMHIVIIEITLDFSALVMTETVLTYIGVGVEPGTGSWGRMIMMADRELANGIWWNLSTASAFLFILVLAFNTFADTLRDALDPRLRKG